MEKGTWRNLALAAAAGLVAYIACVNWLTNQRPRVIVTGPWQDGTCAKLELSADSSFLRARIDFRERRDYYVFRVSDGRLISDDLADVEWSVLEVSPDEKSYVREVGIIRNEVDELRWYHHVVAVFGMPKPLAGIQWGVKLLDVRKGDELAFFRTSRLPTFSADGRSLVLLNADDKIEVWDLPLRATVPSAIVIAALTMLLIFLSLQRNRRQKFS